jgi:pimeloyl-ACP methyl ester carboxylesterase
MPESVLAYADGAKTIVETWGESGPLLVCVHGMTSSRRAWTRLARRIERDHRIVAYDQRGHGDAADFRGPMRLQQHVADLEDVLASVDAENATLIGHSWGGAVAILAGASHRVRGVIAIDPVLRVLPGTFVRDYLEDTEAMAALGPQERERMVRSSYPAWHALDVEGKWHAVKRMTAEPIARLGAENRVDEGGWDLRETIEAYPKPLLVLAAGPDDSVMSRDDVAHVEKRGGPNVRLVAFGSEGHNLHRTAFDAFAAEVEAFVQSL